MAVVAGRFVQVFLTSQPDNLNSILSWLNSVATEEQDHFEKFVKLHG